MVLASEQPTDKGQVATAMTSSSTPTITSTSFTTVSMLVVRNGSDEAGHHDEMMKGS